MTASNVCGLNPQNGGWNSLTGTETQVFIRPHSIGTVNSKLFCISQGVTSQKFITNFTDFLTQEDTKYSYHI